MKWQLTDKNDKVKWGKMNFVPMQAGTGVQNWFAWHVIFFTEVVSLQRKPVWHFNTWDDRYKVTAGGDPDTYSIFWRVIFNDGSPQSTTILINEITLYFPYKYLIVSLQSTNDSLFN